MDVSSLMQSNPYGAMASAAAQTAQAAIAGGANSGFDNGGFFGMGNTGWTINYGRDMTDSGKTTTSNPGAGTSGASIGGIPVEWLLIAAVVYIVAKGI